MSTTQGYMQIFDSYLVRGDEPLNRCFAEPIVSIRYDPLLGSDRLEMGMELSLAASFRLVLLGLSVLGKHRNEVVRFRPFHVLGLTKHHEGGNIPRTGDSYPMISFQVAS